MADNNMSDLPSDAQIPSSELDEGPVSVADVERAAAQLRPAWELDDDEVRPSSPDTTVDATDADSETKAEPDDAPAVPIPLSRRSSPDQAVALEEAAVLDESLAPVDAVASLPKRANVEMKDEPSVVLDPGLDKETAGAVDADPFGNASPPSHEVTAKNADESVDVQRRRKNKRIVLLVVGAASLLVVAALIRQFASGPHDEQVNDVSSMSPDNKSAGSAPSTTTTLAGDRPSGEQPTENKNLQDAAAKTPEQQPSSSKPETNPEHPDSKEQALSGDSEHKGTAAPATTSNEPSATRKKPTSSPAKTSSQESNTAAPTTPKPPKPAATKKPPKPAPAKTHHAPPKKPGGGIVRETPF